MTPQPPPGGFSLKVKALRSGRVRGTLSGPLALGPVETVTILVDDRVVAEVPCGVETPGPGEDQSRTLSHILFSPADHDADWLSGPVTFQTARFGDLRADPWFLHEVVRITRISATAEGVEITVEAPRALTGRARPAARIDGRPAYCAVIERGRDDLRLFIPRSLPLDDAPHDLTLFFAAARAAQGASGLFRWPRPEPARATQSEPDVPAAPPPDPAALALASAAPEIDLVIPVHNAAGPLSACLAALERTVRRPWRLHLVDDASAPPTRDFMQAYAAARPWASVQRFEANAGYTRAVNAGIRAGSAPWVVVLNSDAEVAEGWLEGLLEALAAGDDVAGAGPVSNAAAHQSVPRLLDDEGAWFVNPLPPGLDVEGMAALVRELSVKARPETEVLNGFCTLFRRSALEAAGLFDEIAFPLGYGEETDLCRRLRRSGRRLIIADDVYVHHLKSASFGDERRRRLSFLGGRVLRHKHPDYDGPAIRAGLVDCPPLTVLRERLAQRLADPAPRA